MKANYIKLFLLLLYGLFISDSIPVQAKEKSWKLVFYDDFNSIGKERFDTTKWIVPDREPYRYGEIDVVEFFGTDQKSHQTVHSHSSFILGKTEQQNSFAQKVTPNQWHIYGMEWTPAYITMYVDGKITGTFFKSNDSEEVEEGQWTFDRPYYIILNQSVGDESWNTPMLNTIYETEIDWIKVYQ